MRWRPTVARAGWLGILLALLLLATACESGADPTPRAERGRADDGRPAPPSAPRLPGEVLDTVGVVSQNIEWPNSRSHQRHDLVRTLRRPGVDVIGWQEAVSGRFTDLAPVLERRGFDTETYNRVGHHAAAVSWRRSVLTLVESELIGVHEGRYPPEVESAFPPRFVGRVVLRHRASGVLVTVLNTHVNQAIETGQRFRRNLNATYAKRHFRLLAQLFATVTGDVVVGTGDYNFDYRDDARARPRGGISRTVGQTATSSYEALGLRGLAPTRETRWIDYVWLADRTRRREDGTGRAQFARHDVLGGYHSDHAPLVARVRLYGASSPAS